MSMERITSPAEGYCEKYCPDYIMPGCDPEKCVHKNDVAMYEALKSIEGIAPLDRLRELGQADREGRVVVQRFSPGQTVWVVERDEDNAAYDFSGYVFVTSLRGIELVSPKINWSSEIDVILMEQIKSRINCSGGSIEAYPADDCYLTREAAEQALGSDNNG